MPGGCRIPCVGPMRTDGLNFIDVPGLVLQSVADGAGEAAVEAAVEATAEGGLAFRITPLEVAMAVSSVAAAAVVVLMLRRLRDGPSGPMPRDPALGALAMIFFITAGSLGAILAGGLGFGGDAEYARLARGTAGNLLQAACAFVFLISPLYTLGPRPPTPAMRAIGEGVVSFLLVMPLVAVVAILVKLLLVLVGQPPPPPVSHVTLELVRAKNDVAFTIATLLQVAIIVPVAEEAGWRGLLQPAIRSGISALLGDGRPPGRLVPIGSVVATSVLFTAVHWEALPADGRPAGLAMLFVLGIVLGGLRERTGGLAAPIVLHALFNAANLGLVFRA